MPFRNYISTTEAGGLPHLNVFFPFTVFLSPRHTILLYNRLNQVKAGFRMHQTWWLNYGAWQAWTFFFLFFCSPSDIVESWIMSSIGIFWFCMLDLSMEKYYEIEEHCINFKHCMTFLSLPQGSYCSNNWNVPVFWWAI